ncbi:terminase large subunit [Cereibacter changlensis]|uniref:terminase large subunit n=1 Tax=Cereibacter changlensis TaxID=402884 RepID=UPI004034937C
MSARSTYPAWIYDGSDIPDPLGHGERAVRFLRALRHPASTAPKSAFQLDPWQERIVRRIYGPRHPDGSMIVKEVWLQIPRGNRKTSLAAALALLHLLGPERVASGQIIFAASDREQSAIAFKEVVGIVRHDKRLIAATRIYDPHAGIKSIISSIDGSTLKAVSSDGKAQHGTTPTFILADEIHAWQGRDLYEALDSGRVKRGCLWVSATTAGHGTEGLAAEQYAYMVKVASGQTINPEVLPIIFEPGEDDDWLDEDTWFKVNPGMIHGYPKIAEMRSKAEIARDNPAKAYSFRQHNLNTWLGHSREPLFDMATFDARLLDDDPADLEQLPCWLGIDYAVNGDLAAVVGAWRHDDGQIAVRAWFFVPSEGLKERADRDDVPYQRWLEEGFIREVPGPIITQEAVQDLIRGICATHNVQEAAYDPYRFRVAAQELLNEGVPMIEMRQGLLTMGPANGDLERTVTGRMIRHDGHPILRHHFASAVAKRNDTGLVMLTKGKKTDRIDGAVAAAMAVSRACAAESQKSAYSNPEADGLFVF